ncbi:MAG: universal stress protein UspA [Desulfobacteraceae bacterium 4572_123]|nr:MAG: universal stress protein UspA [Desulfobacteraceae bacterium 4572_123]
MEIMVGYDDSGVAKDALNIAMKHAQAFGANVHIVTSMVGGIDVPRKEFDRVEKKLEYAKSLFKDKNIPCKTHLLVRGLEAGEDLVQLAEDTGVDEIVIGIKRRSKVGKLLFGSTAQYLILHAPCPVLTIK